MKRVHSIAIEKMKKELRTALRVARREDTLGVKSYERILKGLITRVQAALDAAPPMKLARQDAVPLKTYEAITAIIADEAAKANVTPDAIVGQSRMAHLVRARHTVCLRARDTGATLAQIGRVLNRDHSSVIHGIRQAESWMGVQS